MAPSADAVTEAVAIYLARRGMQLAELAELRTELRVADQTLPPSASMPTAGELLRARLTREENATDAERGRIGRTTSMRPSRRPPITGPWTWSPWCWSA